MKFDASIFGTLLIREASRTSCQGTSFPASNVLHSEDGDAFSD